MEITKSNFREKLPEISKDIENCTFLSIDGEFTGLSLENTIYPFNTPEEIYHKHLKGTANFIIVQLGVSLFKVEAVENDKPKISCKTYNFYAYPQFKNANFLVQSESLTFLSNNGFDFNKLFKEGLSFCNLKDETKLRADLKEVQAQRIQLLKSKSSRDENATTNYVEVPDCEKAYLTNIEDQITKYIEGTEEELVISNCNGFQRRLIYELFEQKFDNQINAFSRNIENNRKAIVVVRKSSEDDDQKLEEKRQEEEEKKLLDTVGLTLVLKEISNSKKLIIGHNMLLDVMFTIRQFFEPLPDDYSKFKILVHKYFPNIIDTKFVSTTSHYKDLFKSSVLPYLCQKISEPPFEKTDIEWEDLNSSYSFSDVKEHEAGYDAFVTGYLFITLMKFLKLDLDELNRELYKCKQIQPFLNRISLQCGIIQYMYLIGKEPQESRDHVFYVQFPATWRNLDLQEQFKNYGSIMISWVNNTSAFVSLQNRENCHAVIKTMHKTPGFQIKTLNQFMRINPTPLAAAPSTGSPHNNKRHIADPLDEGNEVQPHQSHKKQKKMFQDNDQW